MRAIPVKLMFVIAAALALGIAMLLPVPGHHRVEQKSTIPQISVK